MFDRVERHMGKNGTRKNEVEVAIREREDVRRSGHAPVRVVGAARQIRAMESESGIPGRNGLLTPSHRLLMNLDSLIIAAQIAGKAEC